MKFSVCLVLLVTVWQASAQAPGDESSRCVNYLRAWTGDVYPPNTRMLMDSQNYDQLITGSSAVWQTVDVDGTGSGVSGRHRRSVHMWQLGTTGFFICIFALHVNWPWDRNYIICSNMLLYYTE